MKAFGIILAASLALSTTAFAQSKSKKTTTTTQPVAVHSSYSTYSNGDKEIQIGLGHGSMTSTSGSTTIDLRSSFAMPVYNDNIQAGGEFAYYSTSGYNYFELFGFGNYNLDTDFKNSFYGKAGLGMFGAPNGKGGYDSKFGYMVGGGKRFPMWERVSYNPELRIFKKGDADMITEIQFLNLSIIY